MGKDNFVKNSFLLTASNITTGILGFIFSIYLSNLIGPKGIGLYSLVMPIYNLFICLMTAGIIAAISQVSAVYNAKGEYNNIRKTMKTVAIFNIVWAVIIGIIVFILAPFISKYGVNDVRTVNAIRVTCPAMVFIALSNILKGYFYGVSKITMPSFIDILEKAMRVLTLALLIFMFKSKTIEGLVTLAYVSLAIGELQSLLLLFTYYKHLSRKAPITKDKPERASQLLFNVFIIAFPLCINGFLGNLFATASTLIIPRRLIVAGFDYSTALGLIGKFTGMALTIISFPMIVVSSINSLIIPDLSQTLSKGEYYNATVRIRKVMKIAFLLGLATTIICNIIPDSLGQMFYNRDDLGQYIKISSLCAPILFTSTTMFGILNGLNKQGIILRNSLIVAFVELISLFIFTAIPSINILGYALTMFITSTLSLAINLYEVKKHLDLNLSKTNISIFILLSILIYMILNILSITLLKDLFIAKNIIICVLSFGIFAILSFFGVVED
ncbi:stage V sporulation protein B [Clostridium chauvoei]|uniref:Multidrug-efflux transporter n=2 Tax=Clostridium chauvoei TaxID=46867 RepID=A0A1U6JL82_9CLOT|nr:stage V sporulation protein B [Clostridium chauvoei]ATD55650.1 stage V sporulation protein B [Clostridium chauvoei]ATD56672.1 stage V sporulation protein B [Clostridium chauvoei]MBX7280112.1 stage V sporulation protein B [Clostridium chauvoei]MBX7282596.1 stage V sporulation protein B [Clostridium chauvoei]MBX7285003.1 stage V sporulation protein B [Clostridium chauvoei]